MSRIVSVVQTTNELVSSQESKDNASNCYEEAKVVSKMSKMLQTQVTLSESLNKKKLQAKVNS